MNRTTLVVIFIIWLISFFITWMYGTNKGYGLAGFFFGLSFSLFGIAILNCLPRRHNSLCKICYSDIHPYAQVCPYCKSKLKSKMDIKIEKTLREIG